MNPDGTPAARDRISLSGPGQFTRAEIDNDGYFSAAVSENARYSLGFYKIGRQQHAAVRNGTPHLYKIGDFSTSTGVTSIGEIELPEAYLLDVQIVDENDEPVRHAEPGLRHGGWGTNDSLLSINEDGLLVIRDADFTGMEMVGDTRIELFDREYTRTVSVTDHTEVKITVDYDNKHVKSFEVISPENSSQEEEETQTEETTTRESTPEEETTTQESSETAQEVTESTQTTVQENAEGTRSSIDSDNSESPSNKSMENSSQTRGFFSNDGDRVHGYLSDPFYLTVSGFILSTIGILGQLLRGR